MKRAEEVWEKWERTWSWGADAQPAAREEVEDGSLRVPENKALRRTLTVCYQELRGATSIMALSRKRKQALEAKPEQSKVITAVNQSGDRRLGWLVTGQKHCSWSEEACQGTQKAEWGGRGLWGAGSTAVGPLGWTQYILCCAGTDKFMSRKHLLDSREGSIFAPHPHSWNN